MFKHNKGVYALDSHARIHIHTHAARKTYEEETKHIFRTPSNYTPNWYKYEHTCRTNY